MASAVDTTAPPGSLTVWKGGLARGAFPPLSSPKGPPRSPRAGSHARAWAEDDTTHLLAPPHVWRAWWTQRRPLDPLPVGSAGTRVALFPNFLLHPRLAARPRDAPPLKTRPPATPTSSTYVWALRYTPREVEILQARPLFPPRRWRAPPTTACPTPGSPPSCFSNPDLM